MNKKVIIIGGEGNGGVIAACIEDNRKRFGDLEWEVAGFVNDYETQDSAVLEPGVFVMSNCYVGAQARLGQCSLMMANSLVGHNTTVGPLCHFSVGSITSSYITIGLCSDVTLGAKVIEKVKIGDFAVAGAGSLVTHNIPDYEIHVGTPAKFMKRVRED